MTYPTIREVTSFSCTLGELCQDTIFLSINGYKMVIKMMLDLVVIVTSEHLNSKESRKGIVNFYQRKKTDPRLLTSRGS